MVMELRKFGEIWQVEGVVASSLGTKSPCSFHFCSLRMPTPGIQPPYVKLRHIYRMTKATWRETQRPSVMFWC